MNKLLTIFLFPILLIVSSCNNGGGGNTVNVCDTCNSQDIINRTWEIESETRVYTSSCELESGTWTYYNESFYTINDDGGFTWNDSPSGSADCEGTYSLDENDCELYVDFEGTCPELETIPLLLDASDGGPFDICVYDDYLTLQGNFNLAVIGLPSSCSVTVTYILVED